MKTAMAVNNTIMRAMVAIERVQRTIALESAQRPEEQVEAWKRTVRFLTIIASGTRVLKADIHRFIMGAGRWNEYSTYRVCSCH